MTPFNKPTWPREAVKFNDQGKLVRGDSGEDR